MHRDSEKGGHGRELAAGVRVELAPFSPHRSNETFVEFTFWWYGNSPSLNVWADITVFDPSDP